MSGSATVPGARPSVRARHRSHASRHHGTSRRIRLPCCHRRCRTSNPVHRWCPAREGGLHVPCPGTVEILLFLLGVSAWLGINGLFKEAYGMQDSLPEGQALGARLVLITQLGNILPLVFGAVWLSKRNVGNKDKSKKTPSRDGPAPADGEAVAVAVTDVEVEVEVVDAETGDAVVASAIADLGDGDDDDSEKLQLELELQERRERHRLITRTILALLFLDTVVYGFFACGGWQVGQVTIAGSGYTMGLYLGYFVLASLACLTNLLYWPFVALVCVPEEEKAPAGVAVQAAGPAERSASAEGAGSGAGVGVGTNRELRNGHNGSGVGAAGGAGADAGPSAAPRLDLQLGEGPAARDDDVRSTASRGRDSACSDDSQDSDGSGPSQQCTIPVGTAFLAAGETLSTTAASLCASLKNSAGWSEGVFFLLLGLCNLICVAAYYPLLRRALEGLKEEEEVEAEIVLEAAALEVEGEAAVSAAIDIEMQPVTPPGSSGASSRGVAGAVLESASESLDSHSARGASLGGGDRRALDQPLLPDAGAGKRASDTTQAVAPVSADEGATRNGQVSSSSPDDKRQGAGASARQSRWAAQSADNQSEESSGSPRVPFMRIVALGILFLLSAFQNGLFPAMTSYASTHFARAAVRAEERRERREQEGRERLMRVPGATGTGPATHGDLSLSSTAPSSAVLLAHPRGSESGSITPTAGAREAAGKGPRLDDEKSRIRKKRAEIYYEASVLPGYFMPVSSLLAASFYERKSILFCATGLWLLGGLITLFAALGERGVTSVGVGSLPPTGAAPSAQEDHSHEDVLTSTLGVPGFILVNILGNVAFGFSKPAIMARLGGGHHGKKSKAKKDQGAYKALQFGGVVMQAGSCVGSVVFSAIAMLWIGGK